jgi:hypothetical protein
MCLTTLHDKVGGLGPGASYERHWAGAFRDLFDSQSAEWGGSDPGEKVVGLKAFESAGVPVAELIAHYRETHARGGAAGPHGPGALLPPSPTGCVMRFGKRLPRTTTTETTMEVPVTRRRRFSVLKLIGGVVVYIAALVVLYYAFIGWNHRGRPVPEVNVTTKPTQ